MNPKQLNALYLSGGILLLAGSFAHFLKQDYAIYIFVLGAIATTIVKVKALVKTTDRRIRRLQNQQMISVLLLLATAYLIFINHDAWPLTLLLAATFDLVISYRMPKE